MKPRFSIRYKFLFVMTGLLGACVALYLTLAVRVFKTDKTELVFDLNRSNVSNLASDVENQFRSVSDKMELLAVLAHRKDSIASMVDDLLTRDSGVVRVSMGRLGSEKLETHFVNEVFLKTYAITPEFFSERLEVERPVPWQKLKGSGEEIWNASLKDGPPMIGYARSVIRESETGVPVEHLAVVAYLRADRLLQALGSGSLNRTFVVNDVGTVLAHGDTASMEVASDLSQHPLVSAALKAPVKAQVSRFDWQNEENLGAWARSYKGKVFVVSEVPVSRAFAAVDGLVRRSLLFGSIVVTIAFMVAILLSRSLTKPLEVLMFGMDKVGEGDLSTEIKVRSRDEIAVLATRFNTMIKDLRTSREQLEEINRELENKVKDRTRRLEEQNQAVKEAQEALLRTTRLAAVGEIAGRAAHEVLNPLTSLVTRLQKVQRRNHTDYRAEFKLFQEIQSAWSSDFQAGGLEKLVEGWKKPSSVEPGKSLIDEDLGNLAHFSEVTEKHINEIETDANFLLDQSSRINRIVSGMRTLSVVKGDASPQNGSKLVHESVNIMADLFGQKGVVITEKHEDKEAIVLVDRDEFIQAITNLLRNSLQAIAAVRERRPDQGQVEIRSRVESGAFVIEIDDNGIGISSDDQRKLFETQFSTKTPEEGTGLGLSISRRFLRAIGGEIVFLHSKPLYSTVFKVTLPLKKSGEVAA